MKSNEIQHNFSGNDKYELEKSAVHVDSAECCGDDRRVKKNATGLALT